MAKREIKFYKHYFNEFYVAQTDKVRKKIAQTLVWLQTLDRLPVTILKSIEGKKGLFESKKKYSFHISRFQEDEAKAVMANNNLNQNDVNYLVKM